MLVANTLINNAADTEDAATPGPTGINIYSLMPISGNMVIGNSIQGEAVDVAIHAPAIPIPNAPSPALVQFNALEGNGIGVDNLSAGSSVNATENFWSCPNGPTIAGSCSTLPGRMCCGHPGSQRRFPRCPASEHVTDTTAEGDASCVALDYVTTVPQSPAALPKVCRLSCPALNKPVLGSRSISSLSPHVVGAFSSRAPAWRTG